MLPQYRAKRRVETPGTNWILFCVSLTVPFRRESFWFSLHNHITICTIRHLNTSHNHAFARGNLHHSVTLLLLSRLPSLAGWAFLHHACSWSSVFVALTSPPSLLVNCFLFIISIFSSYPDLFLSLKYFFCHCTAQKFAFFCLYFSKEKNPFDFKRWLHCCKCNNGQNFRAINSSNPQERIVLW